MRGLLIRKRRRRLIALGFFLAVLCFVFWEGEWIKSIAEDKIAEFLGNRFSVRIGAVRGGIFSDMILQDVSFISEKEEDSQIFRLDRIEIPYRVWQALLERTGLVPLKKQGIRSMGIYFSEDNPFVQGFVKLDRYPEKIELMGHMSFEIFGDNVKRGVKGMFLRQEGSIYDCDLLWDGRIKITGTFAPDSRSIDLRIASLSEKDREMKIKGTFNQDEDICVYSRLYKWHVSGTEIIGDFSLSYRDDGLPKISFKAENLVVDKCPLWNIMMEGYFNPDEKKIFLDKAMWGESLQLKGCIGTDPPYPAHFLFLVNDVRLQELYSMFGHNQSPMQGIARAEIRFNGPVKNAEVSGRLFINEGRLGEMEFRSMFATLSGDLPVIKVSDARVVKEGGHIIVTGEIDISKFKENRVMENLVFETDNKVAVWENWQISKEEKSHVVEARKDKVIFHTSFEKDEANVLDTNDRDQREVGFQYKLDSYNSVKMEMEEEGGDFLGLEHKVQF